MLGFAAHPRQAQAELQGGGADRALDVRAIGIFTEPCAIIDPIFRRDAAGDQRPAWPLGGLQIARQSAVMEVAAPRSGISARHWGRTDALAVLRHAPIGRAHLAFARFSTRSLRCTSRSSFFVIENTSFHHWNNAKGVSEVTKCLYYRCHGRRGKGWPVGFRSPNPALIRDPIVNPSAPSSLRAFTRCILKKDYIRRKILVDCSKFRQRVKRIEFRPLPTR